MAKPGSPRGLSRRQLLISSASAMVVAGAGVAAARTFTGSLPWAPGMVEPPAPAFPGGWYFFTAQEGAAVEALVDRIIPPDDGTPGGKQAGCAVFIDRQLAGPYGRAERMYMKPPFAAGSPQQGVQTEFSPAEQYRRGLAALDRHCRDASGKPFVEWSAAEQDGLLGAMEKGELLTGAESRTLFGLLLQNSMEGFFADPIYGGNRDMAGWKLIGFPGARYDYRDYIAKHNEELALPPVGLQGRAEWIPASR